MPTKDPPVSQKGFPEASSFESNGSWAAASCEAWDEQNPTPWDRGLALWTKWHITTQTHTHTRGIALI